MKTQWIDPYDKEKYIIEREDYIEAYGGDGTLIKSIHMFKETKKPIFGIAGGTLNFLMNEEKELQTNYRKEQFNLIKVNVIYEEEIEDINCYTSQTISKEFQAFNDIVLGQFNGWIDFICDHEDKILGDFKGSGIIVSTSQGSTGINKNNHGTILPLSSKNWCVTGMQTNRNINYVIEPSHLNIKCKSRQSVTLCIDGHYKVINNIKEITLTQGEEVELIFNNYQSFKEKRQ